MTLAYLDWPVRAESVAWRVWDVDLNGLGELMVSRASVPTITNDTTRSIRRAVSSITVLPRPLHDEDPLHVYAEDVDSLSMHVAPFFVFGDGSEYQMGEFVWGDDSQVLFSSGMPRTGALTDLCAALDQPLPHSVGYAANMPVSDAIDSLLGRDQPSDGDVTIQSFDGIAATDAIIGVAIGFAAGRDTTLTALDALCKLAGFLPPYFDNRGVLTCRPAPDVATEEASFFYGAGDSVVPGTAVFSNDLLTAPNRYQVIGGNTDAELVGIFDVPDSAPNSFVNTGRYRVKTENLQGITTQTQADQAAAALYATDISSYIWLSFDAARVDPRHDTWDIVSFDGTNYREVGWSIEARPGGHMKHSLRGAFL